jgi:hypothetical protein
MRFLGSFAIAFVLLSGLAQADTRAYEKAELARFERYAADPIEQFPMFELWQWQVVGPDRVVVWSTIHDAYLLRVDKACNNLLWTHGLSVTQEMTQKVTLKFDFVVFRDQRCKIEEIRPVDYRAMVKDGYKAPDAAKKAATQESQASGGT